MEKKELFEQLDLLGFPVMDAAAQVDVNASLAEVVRLKDMRLWEGFPLLLANSVKKGLFDYSAVERHLKEADEKKTFRQLVLVSLAFYKSEGLKFAWFRKLLNSAKLNLSQVDEVREEVKKGKEQLDGLNLSAERMTNVFKRYYQDQQEELNGLVSLHEEFSLEYALAQVFSPKQKELFFKKLKREKLTKTEKEYYSRVVKKKVLALANEQLFRLSQQLLEKG